MGFRLLVLLMLAAASLIGPSPAMAQVPPHVPGEICFTPRFWCWSRPPGRPGAPCACQLSDGSYVRGTLN